MLPSVSAMGVEAYSLTHVANRFASYVQIPTHFPQDLAKNTRVYAPGVGTIAAKMPRINPDPKKNTRGKFCGRSEKTLMIYLVGARDIAWDLSGGRLGNRLAFFRWALGTSLGIYPGAARHPPETFANMPYPIGRRFQKTPDPTH